MSKLFYIKNLKVLYFIKKKKIISKLFFSSLKNVLTHIQQIWELIMIGEVILLIFFKIYFVLAYSYYGIDAYTIISTCSINYINDLAA